MNNQDVRKYLRKGEAAVKVLESLGYQFKEPNSYTRPEWIAPEVKEDSLEKAIKELVLKETSKAFGRPAGVQVTNQPKQFTGQGPHWESVSKLIGKRFGLQNGSKTWTCRTIQWHPIEGVYKVSGSRISGVWGGPQQRESLTTSKGSYGGTNS